MQHIECVTFSNRTWSPDQLAPTSDPIIISVIEILPFIIYKGETRNKDDIICGPLLTLMKHFVIKMGTR